MCGITGLWNLRADAVRRPDFDRFTDSLAHRGPDGRGVFHDSETRLSLGHRRLAIFDLSPTGNQPMTYGDGKYVITYNGAVYNYVELRERLQGLGHKFSGASDTEVIIAAYAQWGEECQLLFNGMWAFAIWNRDNRTLFLSRDRFGVKPLHYFYDGSRFAFASEMKAFLACEWFDRQFDAGIVARALDNYFSIEGSEDCLLSGVRRLSAGHCMVVRENHPPEIKRWWRTLEHLETAPTGLARQAERFGELFFDACKIRMRSDVPVCSGLSGGLDSGSIVSVLGQARSNGLSAKDKIRNEDFKAFVMSFPGYAQDERAYAEQVISHSGVSSFFKEMTPMEGVDRLREILYSFEEIYDLPTAAWVLYKEMSDHKYRVSIDGHGGDELLGGYHRHVANALQHAAWPVPRPFRHHNLMKVYKGMCVSPEEMDPDLAAGLARTFYKRLSQWTSRPKRSLDLGHVRKVAIYGAGEGGKRAADFARQAGWEILCFVDTDPSKHGVKIDDIEVKAATVLADKEADFVLVASGAGKKMIFNQLEKMGMEHGKGFVFYLDLIQEAPNLDDRKEGWVLPGSAPHPWLRAQPKGFELLPDSNERAMAERLDPVNRLLYTDFHRTYLPTILRNFDRVSMAHAVEIRAPFLDWRLACYAFSLPWKSKIGGGYTKRVLREAMRGILPETIRTRKTKIGFASPVAEWMAGPLKQFVLDIVNSNDFLKSEIWQGSAIRDAVERLYASGEPKKVFSFWPYIQAALLIRVFREK